MGPCSEGDSPRVQGEAAHVSDLPVQDGAVATQNSSVQGAAAVLPNSSPGRRGGVRAGSVLRWSALCEAACLTLGTFQRARERSWCLVPLFQRCLLDEAAAGGYGHDNVRRWSVRAEVDGFALDTVFILWNCFGVNWVRRKTTWRGKARLRSPTVVDGGSRTTNTRMQKTLLGASGIESGFGRN